MILYLLVVITLVRSEDIKDLDLNQLLELATDISRLKIGDVADDDVTFYLATRNSTQMMTQINDKTKNNLDLALPTKFIIHGWIENNRRSWYRSLTEELLKNEDCNVIQVDWERPARSAYMSSAANTKLVGNKLADFVVSTNISPETIHIIGHSLGAHIAGFAAKKVKTLTGKTIARISGLDPAGPHFREYFFVKEERLDKDDANIVDAMHTDAGIYGIEFPLGTLDIYVNGGRGPQPGCLNEFSMLSIGSLIEHSFCSHARSIKYFIEWINNGKFYCQMCNSWKTFIVMKCARRLVLGKQDVNENVTGICITSTSSYQPYLFN